MKKLPCKCLCYEQLPWQLCFILIDFFLYLVIQSPRFQSSKHPFYYSSEFPVKFIINIFWEFYCIFSVFIILYPSLKHSSTNSSQSKPASANNISAFIWTHAKKPEKHFLSFFIKLSKKTVP